MYFLCDYYGISHNNISSKKEIIDKLLYIREHYAINSQEDYFDDEDIVGWIRNKEKNPLVCLLTNNLGGTKKMNVGNYQGMVFEDIYGNSDDVVIDNEGYGEFSVENASMSIYMIKGNS